MKKRKKYRYFFYSAEREAGVFRFEVDADIQSSAQFKYTRVAQNSPDRDAGGFIEQGWINSWSVGDVIDAVEGTPAWHSGTMEEITKKDIKYIAFVDAI